MKSRHVFARHSSAELPIAVSGDGCFLVDKFGGRYLDASSGAAVSCLGHSDQEVLETLREQSKKLSFAHTSFFTNEPAENLASRLADLAPDGVNRVYIVSGGSEAVESAIKLARQYFVEIGETARKLIISRRQSYHGNTIGALGAGGNKWRREKFEDLLATPVLISPCYCYRDKKEFETEEEYGQRVADELDREIRSAGPENVMAFIAEPVVGATAGAICPVPGYFKKIRDICNEHGVLLILDEVMCGMGRTGTLFASELEKIIPDIVTIAKGLGAGYQPIGAMLCQDQIHDTIASGSGFFHHGHTYLGHPIACATATTVLKRIVDDGLGSTVIKKGVLLKKKLEQKLGSHPYVGDICGRGLFIGIEMVSNKRTKTPFDPTLNLAGRIKRAAMEFGLICYPSQGTIDGVYGDHVLLAPPFIISDEEMDLLVERLCLAISKASNF